MLDVRIVAGLIFLVGLAMFVICGYNFWRLYSEPHSAERNYRIWNVVVFLICGCFASFIAIMIWALSFD